MTYLLSQPIQVVEYDPTWPLLFQQERQRILNILGSVIVDLEHFGSTSVPGLAAKPLVDLLGALRTMQDVSQCVEPLRSLGYKDAHVYLGGWIIEDRRLFCSGPYNECVYHLHLVQYGSQTWVQNLRFRDYLRAHPEIRDEYARLKAHLAQINQADVDGYTESKTAFIRAIMDGTSGG